MLACVLKFEVLKKAETLTAPALKKNSAGGRTFGNGI